MSLLFKTLCWTFLYLFLSPLKVLHRLNMPLSLTFPSPPCWGGLTAYPVLKRGALKV